MPAKPDRTPHREPPPRTFAEWGPDLVRSARAMADGGSLRLAADFCDELLADDRVQGVLPHRSHGLLGLVPTFEASGDGRRRGRAQRALEAEEDFWRLFPEAELAQLLEWGIVLGVGLAELDWSLNPETGRVGGAIKVWHPRHLRYDWPARAWRLQVEGGAELTIAPGDGRWILYTPYGARRPWARGAWRALARWYLLKQYAIGDWGRHSELHGLPIRAGIGAEGANPKDRDALAADLATLGRDTSLVLPKGYDLKLVEPVAKTWEMFPREIELSDTAASIVLVGQNLTSNVEGGAYAAAKVHERVEHGRIRMDGETLSTCLHDQALTWWAEFNFGDRRLAPWPSWPTDPPAAATETEPTEPQDAANAQPQP